MVRCNVYNDFSHFVATPIERRSSSPRKVNPKTDFDKVFDDLYERYVEFDGLKNDEFGREDLYKRLCFDLHNIYGFGAEYSLVKDKVRLKLNNKAKAEFRRQLRFLRKSALFKAFWTHFVTISYSDEYLNEKEFKEKLREFFSNMKRRYGWLIAGKFERGDENGRLHFHGLARILPGTSFSKIEDKIEYNKMTRRMELRHANVALDEKFGRTDFATINQFEMIYGNVALYVSKYTNKSVGEAYYSEGIPSGFVLNVEEEEIAVMTVTELRYIDKKTEEEKKLEKIKLILRDSSFKTTQEEFFDVNIFGKHRRIQYVS